MFLQKKIVFLTNQSAVRHFLDRQVPGVIVNTASLAAKVGAPFLAHYSASKFAVGGLTESMRVELAPHNIRVTCVCPALTETEFFAHVTGHAGPRAKSEYLANAKKMPAHKVARKIVATIGKNKGELVFTVGGKFLVLVNAISPRLGDKIMKIYYDDLMKAAERDDT